MQLSNTTSTLTSNPNRNTDTKSNPNQFHKNLQKETTSENDQIK
jgi:hypothetical protein